MIPQPDTRRLRGELLRFWVESKTRADWHLVDMSTRQGHGSCDCEAFTFCFYPNWKRHGRHVPYEYHPDTGKCGNSHEASECSHIRACRERLYTDFVLRLWAMQEQGETEWFRRLVKALEMPAPPSSGSSGP